MDKADFSEQGAFRWIQKTSMDQRIPKKRLAMAIIAKYGVPDAVIVAADPLAVGVLQAFATENVMVPRALRDELHTAMVRTL